MGGSRSGREADFARILSRGFQRVLRRRPSAAAEQAFSSYLSLLLQWTRAHHLTGYRTPSEIAEKLFIDSLLFLRWVPPGHATVMDLGAGAGIPGLPMKIAEPRIQLTLVESRRRPVSFLVTVVRELRLEGVSVLSGRAEVLLHSHPQLQGAFDLVVARAVSPPAALLPLAMVFLGPGGRFVASGPPAQKRLAALAVGIPHRWETLAAGGRTGGRRFLIAEKS